MEGSIFITYNTEIYATRERMYGKNSGEVRIHPTQKPVAMYKWIFKNYAKAGQWVIDTHLGSQSSRIAAYEAGLNFIGFELDEDYFKQGCERFDWYVKQLKLF
ncbi:MAG TPA: hypothetical protein DCS12_08995 [Clostridiales bacterium]|nr:hypothetical protein [Clostridiales bacterium]